MQHTHPQRVIAKIKLPPHTHRSKTISLYRLPHNAIIRPGDFITSRNNPPGSGFIKVGDYEIGLTPSHISTFLVAYRPVPTSSTHSPLATSSHHTHQ
jgi:hypothetical protein